MRRRAIKERNRTCKSPCKRPLRIPMHGPVQKPVQTLQRLRPVQCAAEAQAQAGPGEAGSGTEIKKPLFWRNGVSKGGRGGPRAWLQQPRPAGTGPARSCPKFWQLVEAHMALHMATCALFSGALKGVGAPAEGGVCTQLRGRDRTRVSAHPQRRGRSGARASLQGSS